MVSTVPLTVGKIVLLGRDYPDYGAVAATAVGSHAAAAISVGADQNSPSKQFKYDRTVDNEDACCLMAAPDWVGMAVADAHYGPESSHMLIERLHTIWSKIRPTDLDHLAQMIEFLRNGEPPMTESETTLMVSVYDRATRRGFGISFGDSSLSIVGPTRSVFPANPHDHQFVSAHRGSLRHGTAFRFEAEPGELLLAYTDGVDGCHYRRPETSVQGHHLQDIGRRTGFDALATVNEVTSLALRGVDGNPGGQDNIVICAANA